VSEKLSAFLIKSIHGCHDHQWVGLSLPSILVISLVVICVKTSLVARL
jgi:hypothetical protein